MFRKIISILYYCAERAGSGVGSTDWSIPPEAKPRTNRTQWNAGWTAWNCERGGIKQPQNTHLCSYMEKHDDLCHKICKTQIIITCFIDCSTSSWALNARRPPSVLCEHWGDWERWITLTVSTAHTFTYTKDESSVLIGQRNDQCKYLL